MMTGPDANAIEVRGLTMAYGGNQVVNGLDLTVRTGELVAVLGPNGAGKTTTIEILEGLRNRTGGEVSVLGHDPQTAARIWLGRVGIVPQESEQLAELSAAETLAMQAGYYSSPLPVEKVLSMVGLTDSADVRVRKMSGGQQRRLDLGRALIGDPELLFLDEPTTGFDPSARREAWDLIAQLRDGGRTVVLTTHYMDEAEVLADRIVMISGGVVVATGTSAELADRLAAATRIRWHQAEGSPQPPASVDWHQPDEGGFAVDSADPTSDLNTLTGWAIETGVNLEGLSATRPDLEDVFLSIAEGGGAGSDAGGETSA